MTFFLFILCVLLCIWVIILQDKINSISITLDSIKRVLANNKYTDIPEPPAQTLPPLQTTEPPIDTFIKDEEIIQENHTTLNSISEKNIAIQKTEEIKNDSFDFQKEFLGNIVNKIGAVAIIIALIIFIKLISPYIVFTPWMKIISGYIACCIFLAAGFKLHNSDKMKNYSEVLLGTGFAGMFITTFCAYNMFDLINTAAVISIGAILLCVTYFIAHKMQTISMLVIGLIGAYLTPICSGTETNTSLAFWIFVNMISVVFTLKNKKANIINVINLILTMIIFACYHSISTIHIAFPLILWATYLICDLHRNKEDYTDNVLSYINYGVLTLFSIAIFYNAKIQIAILLAFTGVAYLILSLIARKNNNSLYRFYDYSVLLNLWLVVFFAFQTYEKAICWSILGLLTVIVINKIKTIHLTEGALGCFIASVVTALCAKYNGDYCFLATYTPIINPRTLLFGIPVLSMFLSANLIKSNDKKIYNIFNFGALSLGYLYLLGEINSIMSNYSSYDLTEFNKTRIFIIIGLIYSLNAMRLSIKNNSELFKWGSICAFVISLLALVLGSYSYPQGILPILNFRCAAYIFAIISCFIFSKWDKSEIYKYVAVILGFLLCHSESVCITNMVDNISFIISLEWILYSGAITIFGIIKSKKYLINCGIGLIILSILRIFVFDLANVDMFYKLLAFLTLGGILLLVSYIYTAKK